MFGGPRPAPDRSQNASSKIIPAATGGWNARDSIANMPETDAPILINWFPQPSQVTLRMGYSIQSSGLPNNPVETLAYYDGGIGAQAKIWGWCNGAIYDCTATGAVGAAAVSGLSNSRWVTVNFTTTGGVRYLVCVNGADFMEIYSAAGGWQQVTGVSAPISVTGIATNTISYITSHKNRLWCAIANSAQCYYLPTGAFGAASLFDLSPVLRRGGNIVAIETWTIDGGYGMNDNIVFISSNGEAVIYSGTDPSSASTWALIGVYDFGNPIGKFPMLKYGGDILLLNQNGLDPLAETLASNRVSGQSALTDKIQKAVSAAVSLYGGNFGWQICAVPSINALVLNVPVSSTSFVQYVMCTLNGSWTQFTGWNASCWLTIKGNQYFGGQGFVAAAFQGYADNGGQIATDYQAAFNYFDHPEMLKQFLMCRPIYQSDGSPGIVYGVNVDFDSSQVTGSPTFVPSTGAVWDASVWDTGTWGGGLTTQKTWQFASGLGYAGAFRQQTTSSGIQINLSAVQYLYKPAAIL